MAFFCSISCIEAFLWIFPNCLYLAQLERPGSVLLPLEERKEMFENGEMSHDRGGPEGPK